MKLKYFCFIFPVFSTLMMNSFAIENHNPENYYETRYKFSSSMDGKEFSFDAGIKEDGENSTGTTRHSYIRVELDSNEQLDEFMVPPHHDLTELEIQFAKLMIAADRFILESIESTESDLTCFEQMKVKGFLPTKNAVIDELLQQQTDQDAETKINEVYSNITKTSSFRGQREDTARPESKKLICFSLGRNFNHMTWMGVQHEESRSRAYNGRKASVLYGFNKHSNKSAKHLKNLMHDLHKKVTSDEDHKNLEIMEGQIAGWISSDE